MSKQASILRYVPVVTVFTFFLLLSDFVPVVPVFTFFLCFFLLLSDLVAVVPVFTFFLPFAFRGCLTGNFSMPSAEEQSFSEPDLSDDE